MKTVFILPFFIIITFLGLSSCNDNRVYEYNYIMRNNQWFIDTVPSFEFQIDNSVKQYNVYLNVRNSIAYNYCNLFLKYEMFDSNGNKLQGQQVEFMLLDSRTGRPLGSGSGDLFFNQMMVLNNYKFPKNGKYKIKVHQYMRENPLKEIMAAGVRVEEVIKK